MQKNKNKSSMALKFSHHTALHNNFKCRMFSIWTIRYQTVFHTKKERERERNESAVLGITLRLQLETVDKR
jgi:hypothetical protein